MAELVIAEALGATEIKVKADCQIVVNKVLATYTTKGEKLKKYLQLTWEKHD